MSIEFFLVGGLGIELLEWTNKASLISLSAELCHPSPCGVNTKCDVIGGTPTCTCLPGFFVSYCLNFL